VFLGVAWETGNWDLFLRRVGARGLQQGVSRGQLPVTRSDSRDLKTGVQTTDGTNGTDKQGLGLGSSTTCEVNDQPGWETGFQPRPSVESVESVVWVWELVSHPRRVGARGLQMGVPRDQIPAIPFVVGKVDHAKTRRRKGGSRMCSVLVSLRLERSGREESRELVSHPAPRGGTRPTAGSSQRPVARYQRRRSGNWRLGTGNCEKTGFQGDGSSVGCGVRGR